MKVVKTKSLNTEEKEVVFSLWNDEYPGQLGFNTTIDMDKYLATLHGLEFYLLKNDIKFIEGWAMTFRTGEEKWFTITVSNKVQRQGKGRFLLDKLKADNNALNGWVIDHENDTKRNGEIYQSPLEFYKKNGFRVFPEYRLEIPVLSAVKIAWSRSYMHD
jgi:hypothetical protein